VCLRPGNLYRYVVIIKSLVAGFQTLIIHCIHNL
jgi:hypothetical protein